MRKAVQKKMLKVLSLALVGLMILACGLPYAGAADVSALDEGEKEVRYVIEKVLQKME